MRSGQFGRSPGRFLDRSPKSGFIPSASLRRLNPFASSNLVAIYRTKANQQHVTVSFFCARQFSPTCRIASSAYPENNPEMRKYSNIMRYTFVDRRDALVNSCRSSSIFRNRLEKIVVGAKRRLSKYHIACERAKSKVTSRR